MPLRHFHTRSRYIRITILCLLALTALPHTVTAQEPSDEASRPVWRHSMQAGNYDRAITELSRQIRAHRDFADLYFNRGLCYLLQKDFPRAGADFSVVIRLKPQGFDAYYNRAVALRSAGEYDRALADLNTAERLSELRTPHAAALYWERARVRYSQGDYAGAHADLDAFMLRKPDSGTADAFLFRSLCEIRQGAFASAGQNLGVYIARKPADPAGYQARAAAYLLQEKYPEAIADCREGLARMPKNVLLTALRERAENRRPASVDEIAKFLPSLP